MSPGTGRRRIFITGIVQGVGFRPFVPSLARRLALCGFVANNTSGIVVEVEGRLSRIAHFMKRLRTEAPPLAIIENIYSEPRLTKLQPIKSQSGPASHG